MIEMKISALVGGYFAATFYDESYASFRDPGAPLKFYGTRMDDITDYEYNESPLNGAPEIRLLALQATSSQAAAPNIIEQAVIPMSPCGPTATYPLIGTITFPNGFYYPTNIPNGYTVLSQWNADLYSSSIRVIAHETDVTQVVITSQTNTETENVSAEFGLKVEDLVNFGVKSSYQNTTTTTYRHPIEDIPLTNSVIYYHEDPAANVRGNLLFGNILTIPDKCDRLSNYLQ